MTTLKPFFPPEYVSPLSRAERDATLEELSPTPRIDCEDFMSTTDQPSPDQAGTWEIDWSDLGTLAYDTWVAAECPQGLVDCFAVVAAAVITEYRRQQAAQGIVEVWKEDLTVLLDHFTGYGDAYAEACKERLAVATEQES